MAKFKDIIKTPYMMRIVIDIMPLLDRMADQRAEEGERDPDGSGDADREVLIVYQAFTKQAFGRKMAELLASEPEDLPPGYDLMQSYHNYSCSLGIAMWADGRHTVVAQSSSFPKAKYRAEPTDAKYAKYFTSDPATLYARRGSLVDIDGGNARFQHRSIMDYFVARVLFDALKYYDPAGKKSIADTYLNARVIDPEEDRYMLSFLVGMIGEHVAECRVERDDGTWGLERCQVVDALAAIIDKAEEYRGAIYLRNAMEIAGRVPAVFEHVTVDDHDEVSRVVSWKEVPRAFKVVYCWAAAKAFRDSY